MLPSYTSTSASRSILPSLFQFVTLRITPYSTAARMISPAARPIKEMSKGSSSSGACKWSPISAQMAGKENVTCEVQELGFTGRRYPARDHRSLSQQH